VAIGLFSVSSAALAWLSISDARERVEKLEAKRLKAEETYLQVKSIDLSGIRHALEERGAQLERQHNRVFSPSWQQDSLPLLLSRIADLALRSGLSTISSVEDIPKPPKGRTPMELPGNRWVRLNITGPFGGIMDFINQLESWNEVLMIHRFRITQPGDGDDLLKTEMMIVIPELNTDG
jgi:hypothetical protein